MAKEDANGNGTVSLTAKLLSVDGKTPMMIGDGDTAKEMDVRRAILLSLLQGSGQAQEQGKLTEDEKLDCYLLSKKISDDDRTGFTFSAAQTTLIKRCAYLRLPTEPFGALVEQIDPGAIKEE